MSDFHNQSFDALIALGPNQPVADEMERRFTRLAAAVVVDFAGLHGLIERQGPAMALLLRRASERTLHPCFEPHHPLAMSRQGSSLYVAFATPHQAILAALDGLAALGRVNLDRPEAPAATAGLGYGELLIDPAGAMWGSELDRAALLAHAGAPGLVLATAALMTEEPPSGVGLHQAPADKTETLGMRFFVVRDYRD